MRKCKVTTNVRTTRTTTELTAMWADHIKENFKGKLSNIINIDPDIDSYERRVFFKSNCVYNEERVQFGLFHEWGTNFTEFESGAGNYTVGIVELSDGSVITPCPSEIEFLPPDLVRREFEAFAQLGHRNLGRMGF